MAGEHILIVDDEKLIQSTLRGVLEDEGYRVTAAGTGEEALARLIDDAPDLVFLDIEMPGMDGLEVCRRIRARSSVPILMLTGAKLEERDLIRVSGTRVVSGIIETRYRIAQLNVRLDRALLSAAGPADEATAAIEEGKLATIGDGALRVAFELGKEAGRKVDADRLARRRVVLPDAHAFRVVTIGAEGRGATGADPFGAALVAGTLLFQALLQRLHQLVPAAERLDERLVFL